MSYLAIARKYRPATFDEIVGQDHVTRTLRNAITSGRIHHAYLFCGARGVGKTTAARALAKSLNCEQGPTPEPCGTCTSCTEIATGSSPDLIEIDGASNNSVDDVRDLRETVHYAPTQGRYKVYLVDEVHMLSKAAFNALLKTLEEPPPHVVFIFATTEPHRILDTILSRVQRFDFKRIGMPVLVQRLGAIAEQEGVDLSENALRMVARAGEGSMRDAQSLLDKVISFGAQAEGEKGAVSDEAVAQTLGLIDRGLLFQFVSGLVKGEPEACLKAVAQVYDYGHEMSQFTQDLLELLRNATFVALSEEARRHVDVSADELERLQSVVEGVPAEQLTRSFNALLDVHDKVSRASRPRIVLEMAVARLATTRPVQPVGQLLARLEQLERSLRGGSGGRGPAPSGSGGGDSRQAPRRGRANPNQRSSSSRSSSSRSASPRAKRAPRSAPSDPDPGPSQPIPPPMTPPPPPSRVEGPPGRGANGQEGGFEAKWKALTESWKTLGPAAKRLATGTPMRRNRTLVVKVPAGRALAEARRVKGEAEVMGAVRRHFPGIEALDVAPMEGTGTKAEHARALEKEVREDPEFQRIIETLGAEVDMVTSLRDEGPSS
ncbi:MAG: DNA polymerase III subunit gamma/tau [Myxococcales bacterium]|nr:DNA polymerase III subunit gamma/tau [Myxococcales bacterium]